MTQRDFLIDCLRRLNSTGVGYMLTGSMASNHWGIPRTTHDIDLVIQLPTAFVPRLAAAFSSDFLLDEETVNAVYRPPHQFNAIDQRSSLKIDFWLLQPHAFERCAFSRKEQVVYFGEPASITTAEDIILHKLRWDKISPSDRQTDDMAGVVAVQHDALDREYLRRWADELGVREKLEALLNLRIRPKST